MRTFVIAAVLLAASHCAVAQTIITSDDMWQLGDYYRAKANPDGVNAAVDGVILGPGEHHWDFTGFPSLTRILRYDYVETSDGGYGQENIFPGADFAERMVDEDVPGQPAWMALGLDSNLVQTFSQVVTTLAPADFYAVPGIRQAMTIPITYTLFNPSGAPMRSVRGYYSPDGGGRWYTATAASGIRTRAFSLLSAARPSTAPSGRSR